MTAAYLAFRESSDVEDEDDDDDDEEVETELDIEVAVLESDCGRLVDFEGEFPPYFARIDSRDAVEDEDKDTVGVDSTGWVGIVAPVLVPELVKLYVFPDCGAGLNPTSFARLCKARNRAR